MPHSTFQTVSGRSFQMPHSTFQTVSGRSLRPLAQRIERPRQNLFNYIKTFQRRRTPMGRINTLKRMYEYFLTIPDFLADNQHLRNVVVRKTHEFKSDTRTEGMKHLFDAILTLCKRIELAVTPEPSL